MIERALRQVRIVEVQVLGSANFPLWTDDQILSTRVEYNGRGDVIYHLTILQTAHL